MTDSARRQTPDELGPNDRRLEDKKLVIAFKQGDASAYDQIYRRYSARVNGVCRRMLFDPSDVQEASQEVFLRVYQALGRFNGRYEMGAWIARIATNVCLDQLRAKTRRPHDFAPLEAVDNAFEGTFNDDTPETILLQRSEGRRVKKLLAAMPPMHRAAIVLRDYEGFSYEEIGKTLGITDVQVKALLHRARQSFKRSWAAGVASALIPTRLFQKLKLLGSSSVETAAAGVTTPQIASSCSTMLQHCGQFVFERVAPVVTVFAVGAAAGVAASNTMPQSTPETISKPAEVDSGLATESVVRKHRKEVEVKPSSVTPATTPEPAATATPAPEASPTTPPEETDPGASGGDGGSSGGEGGHPPPPEATPSAAPPFSPALGFLPGAPIQGPVRSHSFGFNCDTGSFDQRIDASISYNDKIMPATLVVSSLPSLTFTMLVYPNDNGVSGADVEYEGSATSGAATRSATELELGFSGSYDNTDHDAGWKDLPESGTFDLKLQLDCANAVILSETLHLSS